jgi:hypothetical protein
MAWRKQGPDPVPAPLRRFREEDWPPVPGECLEHYSCRANGYEQDCAPRPGEPCGQACYEHLAAEFPGRPEVLAAARRADAYTRFSLARQAWLGEGSDGYLEEVFDATADEIRYAPFRNRDGVA